MYEARRRRPLFGVLLLIYQVFGVLGIEHIPPVTLGIVALHSAIFLRFFKLPWYKPSDVCVSAYSVWYRKEYRRLLFAAFEHGDDWHLYYNMLSFIIKGQALERRFGTIKFLYLTLIFTLLTNATLVGLGVLASEWDKSYETQCAVGFSGVIFALKVLTSYYYPNYNNQIMGFPIVMPANYVVWFELVLIQLLVPNASFLGHLAGIIVGLAYVKGPLKPILDGVYSTVKSIFVAPSYDFTPRAEASGYRTNANRRDFSAYTYGMSEDEELHLATQASLQTNSRTGTNLYPDLDEIRSRRLARYQ